VVVDDLDVLLLIHILFENVQVGHAMPTAATPGTELGLRILDRRHEVPTANFNPFACSFGVATERVEHLLVGENPFLDLVEQTSGAAIVVVGAVVLGKEPLGGEVMSLSLHVVVEVADESGTAVVEHSLDLCVHSASADFNTELIQFGHDMTDTALPLQCQLLNQVPCCFVEDDLVATPTALLPCKGSKAGLAAFLVEPLESLANLCTVLVWWSVWIDVVEQLDALPVDIRWFHAAMYVVDDHPLHASFPVAVISTDHLDVVR
jgi:hypothetical protein